MARCAEPCFLLSRFFDVLVLHMEAVPEEKALLLAKQLHEGCSKHIPKADKADGEQAFWNDRMTRARVASEYGYQLVQHGDSRQGYALLQHAIAEFQSPELAEVDKTDELQQARQRRLCDLLLARSHAEYNGAEVDGPFLTALHPASCQPRFCGAALMQKTNQELDALEGKKRKVWTSLFTVVR